MSLIRLAVAGCFLVAVGASAAPVPKEGGKVDRARLQGKWKLAKTENKTGLPPGTLVEFARGGGLKIEVTVGDQKLHASGSYSVKGDKLTITVKEGGKETKETTTITRLSDKELVIKDDKGQLDTFQKQ